MKRNWKTSFAPGVLFLCAFGIWTVLVQTVDVQSIGAGGTSIGMAAWNLGFHQWTGVHMWMYTLTDWLGLVPVGVCMAFGGLGLVQLVRRKSLWRVDRDILILGVYYVLVIGYFVSQPNHNDMILSLSEELEGTELQYRDIHGILPDARLQELLDIPANRKVIEFSQISRDGDGQPVAFDVKYVPYARAYPSVESEIRYAVLPDLTFAKLRRIPRSR